MSFNFDITGTPPALADITARREQAVNDRTVLKKKNIQFMIALLSVVIVYVTLMVIYVIPMMEQPEVGIITYYFPYFTFVIFVVGNNLHIKKIEKPRKLLDTTIAGLDEVTTEEISNILDNKEHPTEIASYLERVTAQGRTLVRAEMDAIQKWVDVQKLANKSTES